MEEILETVNPIGRYQKLMIFYIGIASALSSITIYSTVFTAAYPDYSCRQYNETSLSDIVINDIEEVCNILTNNSANNYKCSFDDKYYGETIITDWNLVCSREVLGGLTQTFYMLGSFSTLFSGYFGDKYGRKKSSFIFLCLLSITMVILQILMTDTLNIGTNGQYVIYSICQALIGAFVCCLYSTAYVLLLETTTHKYHTLFSNMIAFNYVIGEFIILLIAYFVRHWKTINDILTAFTVLVTIIFFFLVDESPIWLASQKNYKKTMKVLKKIARINKKELNFDNLDSSIGKEEIMLQAKIASTVSSSHEGTLNTSELISIKNTLIAIFTPKSMLVKTCLTSYVWFVSHLLYYGIALGISSVKGINPYILFIFQSIAEITGYWICVLNDKFGRRKMNIIYLLSSAIVCLIYSLLPRNKDLSNEKKVLEDAILVICLISIGKCMVSASFNTLYVYTTELYDTNVRNFGLLFCTCIGSIGSLISPEINSLSHAWGPLPYLIFSISAFIGSISVFILPETLKKSSK